MEIPDHCIECCECVPAAELDEKSVCSLCRDLRKKVISNDEAVGKFLMITVRNLFNEVC